MDTFLLLVFALIGAATGGYVLGLRNARHTLTDGIPVLDLGPFGEKS